MKKQSRRSVAGLGVACLVVLGAGFLIVATSGPKTPPAPKPNGYDDFVDAGRAVSGDPGTFRNLDQSGLSDLISANQEPLRLVRLGLTRKCLMPASSMENISGLLPELAQMKRLALLLTAEGQLAEMQNQPGKAALSYTDAIRFGNEMSRGGPLITRLVGIACEAIGGEALKGVASKLSSEEAARAVAELGAVDRDRVTWAEVMRDERLCARYQRRNQNPITWVVSSIVGWWHSRAALAKAEVRQRIITANERLLMTDLALRSFQARTGTLPARLDDLVTNYLPAVPRDPFSQGALIYRPQPGGIWLVYSVGPDGQDDQGNPASRGWPLKGDLVVGSTPSTF